MSRQAEQLERAGVPRGEAGRRAYAGMRYCGCTFAEGNTVTPHQVRIWSDGTSLVTPPWGRGHA
jgi:hypothetical protein